MDKTFTFHKNDNTTFERKEEYLNQVEMHDMVKEPMCIIDEERTGYDNPRWIEKSNSIKARDNYTCQLCHAFNPMQEGLIFVQQGEYETYHQYSAGSSSYMIHVKDFDFTVNFDFYAGYHLAMPRLNVHHKIYFRNRELWDYEDDCLVTLCEDCHHYIHSLNEIGIPIIEEDSFGHSLFIGKTQPKIYHPQLDHTDLGTFKPLALVKENRWGIGLKGQDFADYERAKKDNRKWYDYQDILDNHVVHIGYFKCYDPRWNKHTPDEINKVADFIITDFIENYLGFSKKSRS